MLRNLQLLCCAFLLCILSGVVTGASSSKQDWPKQDRNWKPYKNPEWGYCVSYPSRWLKGDAFDGAGIYVETGKQRYSKPLGSMDVGALPNPDVSLASARPVSFLDDFEVHLDVLKKFERAESVVILDKREMQLLGGSALFIKDRYYDPQDRADWAEEIVFTRHKGTLYRLELECRADQLARFEPVFDLFMRTFRFDCAASS